jgi:hypothetical protein
MVAFCKRKEGGVGAGAGELSFLHAHENPVHKIKHANSFFIQQVLRMVIKPKW